MIVNFVSIIMACQPFMNEFRRRPTRYAGDECNFLSGPMDERVFFHKDDYEKLRKVCPEIKFFKTPQGQLIIKGTTKDGTDHAKGTGVDELEKICEGAYLVYPEDKPAVAAPPEMKREIIEYNISPAEPHFLKIENVSHTKCRGMCLQEEKCEGFQYSPILGCKLFSKLE